MSTVTCRTLVSRDSATASITSLEAAPECHIHRDEMTLVVMHPPLSSVLQEVWVMFFRASDK